MLNERESKWEGMATRLTGYFYNAKQRIGLSIVKKFRMEGYEMDAIKECRGMMMIFTMDNQRWKIHCKYDPKKTREGIAKIRTEVQKRRLDATKTAGLPTNVEAGRLLRRFDEKMKSGRRLQSD